MTEEKILFQYVMNYKAYRTKMITLRILITLVAMGASGALCLLSLILGIIFAVSFMFIGIISILVALGNEITYTVYNTRIVIKKRGKEKRTVVPVGDIVGIKYAAAFYEKKFSVGTVTVVAKSEKGGKRKYKLKHIFDARPMVEYFGALVDEKRRSQ